MKYNSDILRRKEIALNQATTLAVAAIHAKSKKKVVVTDEATKIYNWLLKTQK